MKEKKKITKSKLKERIDTLFSLVVRTRDRFTCQKEGCSAIGNKRVHCAHIFSRCNLITRWLLLNGITLCYYHHILWSHRQPLEFAEWIQQKLGLKKYNELKNIVHKTELKPVGEIEMLAIESELKIKLKEYQTRNELEQF